MKIKIFLPFITILLSVLLNSCFSAKILALYPAYIKSHFTAVENVLEELVSRGNEIHLVSPFRFTNRRDNMRNKKEINIEGIEKYFKENGIGDVFTIQSSTIEDVPNMIYATAEIVNYTMNYPAVQDLLKDDTMKFDLLIMDQFLTDALLGFAHLYQIPAILTSSSATNKWTNKYVGNPNNPAYNPHIFLGYTSRMTFWQRMLNFVVTVFEDFSYNLLYLPAQESMYQRFFSKPILRKHGASHTMPSLVDLIENVSLVLLNSNKVFHEARAYVPNMLEIGGSHVPASKPLPKEMMHYFSIAEDGIICFSFGGTKTAQVLSKEKLAALNHVFVRMPKAAFIMKWEDRIMENQPDNVVIGTSIPQLDILAHPNVRLLITNGGMLSIYEAIYTKTPIIGIPLFGDQFQNVALLVERHKIGRMLDINNITIESVRDVLEDVLRNPMYKENVEKLSTLMFEDNPDKDNINRTVAYIDLVLKTNGCGHLRSVHLSIWQTYLIDVGLVLLLIILVILAVPSVIIGVILRRTNNKIAKMDQRNNLKATISQKKNK